ncbi:hypothetical protein ONQ69_23480, partial [Salmonella enterica subsp. enterica serovar Kentucky]|nr:hypothetical protein [Salmonella enterica subsp. enterica serovar Kentucky]
PDKMCFWSTATRSGIQKHILSGTQISFGIPSGIPEISTIRAYTYTRITNGTVRAGHVKLANFTPALFALCSMEYWVCLLSVCYLFAICLLSVCYSPACH